MLKYNFFAIITQVTCSKLSLKHTQCFHCLQHANNDQHGVRLHYCITTLGKKIQSLLYLQVRVYFLSPHLDFYNPSGNPALEMKVLLCHKNSFSERG